MWHLTLLEPDIFLSQSRAALHLLYSPAGGRCCADHGLPWTGDQWKGQTCLLYKTLLHPYCFLHACGSVSRPHPQCSWPLSHGCTLCYAPQGHGDLHAADVRIQKLLWISWTFRMSLAEEDKDSLYGAEGNVDAFIDDWVSLVSDFKNELIRQCAWIENDVVI